MIMFHLIAIWGIFPIFYHSQPPQVTQVSLIRICHVYIMIKIMVIPSYTHHILVTIAAMEHHCWWEDHPHRWNMRAVRRTAISSLKHGIQDFSGWAIRVYRVIRCISLLKMNSEKKRSRSKKTYIWLVVWNIFVSIYWE